MSGDTAFWSQNQGALLATLGTSLEGLTESRAARNLQDNLSQSLAKKRRWSVWRLLLSQFASPLLLLLIGCALFMFFSQDAEDAIIILSIVLVSGLLGFRQEYRAERTIDQLLNLVQVKVKVLRGGVSKTVSLEEVVPGDILMLNAGDIIPGDSRILESKNFFVDEAALTGETFPQEKVAGILPEETPLSQRTNSIFMGTHVVSGTARAAVVFTGKNTVFGQTTERVELKGPETEFERGVRHFGVFLLQVTFLLVAFIFALNVFFERPFLESLLFALALAVGLTPQLLPAIISVNLAHGAGEMAKASVIVRKLSAIENFGSMNVLCADKTGTLTEGVIEIHSAVDAAGKENDKVKMYAYLNSSLQEGYENPIDAAIMKSFAFEISNWKKTGEIPYDFIRKRLSVSLSDGKEQLLITKGAVSQVLEVCKWVEDGDGKRQNIQELKDQIEQTFLKYSENGFRVIAIAYRNIDLSNESEKEDEREMTFLGYLVLHDPLKEDIVETIQRLKAYGVKLKIITGDNRYAASCIAEKVLGVKPVVLTGGDLLRISDRALHHKVRHANVFAEVEPNQKERLVLAIRKGGNVVGYLGDGINDVSAMHAADVSISVDSGQDSAKEIADIILLKKELDVLLEGVKLGRLTFANTLKYVFMATSANFGNMFSMAGASLFLNFLPLLPKQVLLTNLLEDLPEMAIASDRVDEELIQSPQRWNIKFIRKFMLVFGLISSIFDFITFGVLLFVLKASEDLFRTGWFLESVASAAMIVLVVRTRHPFYKSLPSKTLGFAVLLVIVFVAAIPFIPWMPYFGFVPLPPQFFIALGAILASYVFLVEAAKKVFYRSVKIR